MSLALNRIFQKKEVGEDFFYKKQKMGAEKAPFFLAKIERFGKNDQQRFKKEQQKSKMIRKDFLKIKEN